MKVTFKCGHSTYYWGSLTNDQLKHLTEGECIECTHPNLFTFKRVPRKRRLWEGTQRNTGKKEGTK